MSDRKKAGEATRVINSTLSALDKYKLNYEQMKKPKKLKKTKGKNEVKTLNTQKTKSIIETLKTIMIVIMITAVTFFVLGMKYQEQQTAKHEAIMSSVLKASSQPKK